MREELQKQIFDICPKMFSQLSYIEAPDGWFLLIKELSIKLEKIVTTDPAILELSEKDQSSYYACQVKSKFGGLRYYTWAGTAEIYMLINEAENKSVKICETCGKPGEIKGDGWIYVACEEHIKK